MAHLVIKKAEKQVVKFRPTLGLTSTYVLIFMPLYNIKLTPGDNIKRYRKKEKGGCIFSQDLCKTAPISLNPEIMHMQHC